MKFYSNKLNCIPVILFLLMTFSLVYAQEQKPQRWDSDINKFLAYDSKNSFPKDAVLFVGSSSVRLWSTQKYFPELTVINRGFGGSQVSDLLNYYDRIVLKYSPRLIVLYSGDNDLAANKTPEVVFNDFKTFINRTHKSLPNTPVIVLSVKTCKARASMLDGIQKVNSMLNSLVSSDSKLIYLDLGAALLKEDGQPDESFFKQDQLHLNPKGYQIWSDILNKTIQKCLVESPKT